MLIRKGISPAATMPRPISWLTRLHEIRRAVASSVRSHYECHAALNSRNHACLFSILFRDLTALSLH
jgi:hypothetical protein